MHSRLIELATVMTMLGMPGCAGSVAGARPEDMSQKQHAAAAAQHEEEGTEHGAQYDSKATTQVDDCTQYLGSCWGTNPTEEHKEQAEEHRRVSAAHRAASQALRDAEDRACHGISEANRDVSPFFHGEAIVSVEPAEEKVTYGKQFVTRTKGAVVVFRAAPGLTAEWFQREIDCHLARAAAVGHEMPEMAYCPLVLKGVKATVSSRGGGFAVQVLADDQQTSDEILRRARTAKR